MSAQVCPVEVWLTESDSSLGSYVLEERPLPGMEISLEGQDYLVMECRHRYALNLNRYELSRVVLWVKALYSATDKTWVEGRWILGNMDCRYNARSPVIRCAVNPDGPCDRCSNFQAIEASE